METKRKRVMVPKSGTAKPNLGKSNAGGGQTAGSGGATDAEMERRLKAVRAAQAREIEEQAERKRVEQQKVEERNRRRQEQEQKEREQREAEARARQKADEEAARLRKDEEDKAKADAERKAAEQAPSAKAETSAPQRAPQKAAPQPTSRKKEREAEQDRRSNKGRDDNRRSGKLTLTQALSGEGGRQRSMASMRRQQERARQKAMGAESQDREKIVREVQLPEAITVSELANRMAERSAEVVKSLMKMGMMVTQNQTIDADTAELIIDEFGHKAVRVSDSDVEDVIDDTVDDETNLKPRPPVITIMGHVDHGKTSLLDAIRKTKVVQGEAGGITQHIGAYQVKTSGGAVLSFRDTPAHAAFTSMRARGAQVTDIVVLVVAADDSAAPQTIEAINHAKAAKVPLIVAINKIDRPAADPDKVRAELLQHEVIVEQMSGEVQDVEVSAITGQGLDDLLEAIALQAEILELQANPDRSAQGAVIEAQLDVGRGPVAASSRPRAATQAGRYFRCPEQRARANVQRLWLMTNWSRKAAGSAIVLL